MTDLLHVYGVVAGGASLPDELVGRGGVPVRLVGDDDLAVLVSDVPEDARVRRDDLLKHAHLLEAVVAGTTVVPVRFGVLVPDEDTVRSEFLGNQRARLLGLLQSFDGCVQVTVSVTYDEESALREVLRRDPALAAYRDALDPSDTNGQVRLGEAVSAALASLREETEAMVVGWLQPYALAASVNEVRGAYDVASVALLVRREDRVRVDAAVADLDRQVSGQMSLRYVGPQPPYAFLDRVVVEERSWA